MRLPFEVIETEWVDPAVEDTVIGFGFPVSAAKIFQGPQVGRVVPKAVLLLVMPFKGKVLPPTTGRFYGGFDADRHYLIPFELAKDGMHPKGISGAATWVKSVDESGVWAPRFKFAGICSLCFDHGNIEQVIRASVVREFLTEVLGKPHTD